jgi:maltose alpha-D-glucosyltransferase / alpha-amylase
VEYIHPNTMFLAEACFKPKEVVEYFGSNGEECQACYHFPLMPQIYLSLKRQSFLPIKKILEEFTPIIPKTSQWFVFLRCHDELTLEMVSKDEQKELFQFYCKDEKWSFRNQLGISSRLVNLLDFDVKKIHLVNSILLTIIGTPIIFYGDEFGKPNDE